jgi:hypothetical protein
MSGSTDTKTAVLAAAFIALESAGAEVVRRRRASSVSALAAIAAEAAKAKKDIETAPAVVEPVAASTTAEEREILAVDKIKAALPAHVFAKDTLRSIGFLLQVRNHVFVL